jgi:hypothetical protein
VTYVHQQLGLPIASTAPPAKTGERFNAAVHRRACWPRWMPTADKVTTRPRRRAAPSSAVRRGQGPVYRRGSIRLLHEGIHGYVDAR